MSWDEAEAVAEAVFVRKPDAIDPRQLPQIAGAYETPGGVKIQVDVSPDRVSYCLASR